MDYVNIHSSTLRTAEYVTATPAQRGTWLNLVTYCCTQENGGKIPAAASWTNLQCIMATGVSLDEVNESCGLWRFEDGALLVAFYPAFQEESMKASREGGIEGNRRRWEKAKKAAKNTPPTRPPIYPPDSPPDLPPRLAPRIGVGIGGVIRNGMEWNGMEGKEMEESDRARAVIGEVSTASAAARPEGSDGSSGTPEPAAEVPASAPTAFAEWPMREEWLAAADMQGLPRELAVREWNNQERKAPDQRWRNIDRRRLQHHAAFVLDCARQRGEVGAQKKNSRPPSGSLGDGHTAMAAMGALVEDLNAARDYPAALKEAVQP